MRLASRGTDIELFRNFMKKFLSIIIVSFFIFNNSFAEWSIWYGPDKVDFYIDKTRIVTNKQTVKFWRLTNLKNTQQSDKGPVNSFVNYIELDCKNTRGKYLQTYVFSGQMGKGNLLESSTSNVWKYPAPNSYEEIIYLKTCAAKDYLKKY